KKKLVVIFFIFLGIILSSSQIKKTPTPAEQVKQYYLAQTQAFIADLENFKKSIFSSNKKTIQNNFLTCRSSYKKAEALIEYYFNFFALRLNGAPVPYFEEEDPGSGQIEPAGMQVIEALIFPGYSTGKRTELLEMTNKLIGAAKTMLQTNESFAFNDEFIIDAVIEELYRVTALGIAGFDSQLSYNAMKECKAALAGVQNILYSYKAMIAAGNKKNYANLNQLFIGAGAYLDNNPGFDAFNRMYFIQNYLTPITKIVTEFKSANNFNANRSAMYYSISKKDRVLFAPYNFDMNRYLDDNKTSFERIELGKKLFFDTQLSVDNKRSCATCHQPNKAFTDGLKTSVALDGHSPLQRNAPTLWNVALQRNLFLDNRSRSLEEQVMQVLNNKIEMHGSAQLAAEKIIEQKEYKELYKKAYVNAGIREAANNICNAIACYERTLIALNSKFDRHMNGQKKLTANEINGFNLFMGKAKCGTCHFTPLFNGSKPPRYYYTESEVIGTPQKNVKQNAVIDPDEGRFLVTGFPMHRYAFKTPTLRNVALTAPYMHNGVFNTLEQVVDFYNNGGGQGLKIAPQNQTLPFDKLNLSTKEKKDIVLFMKALTDTTIAD
ncbi:MAG: cytochrome c peroxidase, partial [Ferruginibacter sp.]